MRLRLWRILLAAGLLAFVGLDSSLAEPPSWPQRIVRVIVPVSAGSGTDIAARLFAERLAARWKQPIAIENRPGADGLIGTAAFAGQHDDHMLMFSFAAAITIYPLIHDKLPYDPDRDIVPIAAATDTYIAVVASRHSKIESLRDLMERARAHPGGLNYNAAAGELPYFFTGFLKGAGIEMVLVTYRDLNLAYQDVAEGRIDVQMTTLSPMLPLWQAGKIRVLAVTNAERARIAPQIPTAVEAGYPGLALEGLAGFFGARDLPDDRRARIAADIRAVAADPVLSERLLATGQIARAGTPEEFSAELTERRARMAAMVKLAGVRPVQ
jgi:tripartite-type tricarboxylate transporter receptor subunit TctC